MIYKDIWKVLGIAPTTDIKAIKSAYSSLAKKTNPEDDPEGFQKLHEAYKSALEYAKVQKTIIINRPSVQKTGPSESTPSESEAKKFEFPEPENKSPSGDQEPKPQFEFPDEDEQREKAQDPVSPKMQFDYSSVSEIPELYEEKSPFTDLKELIRVFKQINHINCDSEILMFNILDRRRLANDLFEKYRRLALTTGRADVWYVFFEEPLIRYFECDPNFREFIVSSLRLKINGVPDTENKHYKTVKALTDHMADLPKKKLWYEKPEKKPWYFKKWKDLTRAEKRKVRFFVAILTVFIYAAIRILMIFTS